MGTRNRSARDAADTNLSSSPDPGRPPDVPDRRPMEPTRVDGIPTAGEWNRPLRHGRQERGSTIVRATRGILRITGSDANGGPSRIPFDPRSRSPLLRIAIVIERFVPGTGGVENVAWQVAHELARVGEDVSVITRDADPAFVADRSPRSPRLHRLRIPGAWQPLRVAAFSHAAARAACRNDFDVVHGFSRTCHQDLYRAGGGSHRDYLQRTHSPGGVLLRRFSPRHRILLAIEKRVFRDPDQRIQCASRLVADRLVEKYGVARDRILLLPNAVDAERYGSATAHETGRILRRRLDGDARQIWLLPGSGWRRKGLPVLLEALARLREPGTHLWIAGRDSPRPWQTLARRLGVEARVRFLGPRSDLENVYAAVDGMVLPTRYDPFANVTLEAAASGLPIVTTRSNGASEWLAEEICLLEDPKNAKELAGHLHALAADPDRSAELGRRARAAARRFDWAGHVRILRDEYRRIRERKNAVRRGFASR
ncbi:MAG TPA: glycosyltransferase family 1 protein [Deltaproteobacteria bacterium]|nr:glycosyltransferase family 1 protein [Deltaproteobacteria bacterium]